MKARVVDVLSSDWPLDKRGIYSRIRKEDGKAAKTQVVAAIRKLEDAGVLIEAKKKFAISLGWLEETKKKAATLALPKNREKLDLSRLSKQNDSFAVSFGSYIESLYAILEELREESAHEGFDDSIVTHWYRACPSIAIARPQFAQVKKIFEKNPYYVLRRGSSPLDMLLLEFWKELGSEFRTGVKCADQANVVVTGDRVVQLFWTPKLKSSMDGLYSKSTKKEMNLGRLYEHVFAWREPVTVVATKNKFLADQIREETLKYFK